MTKVKFTTNINRKLLEEIKIKAIKEGKNVNEIIEGQLTNYLEEKDMTNFRNVRNMEIELSGFIFKVNKNNDFYTLENKWDKKVGALVDLGTTADYTFGELQEIIKRETEINPDYWVAAKQYGMWLVVEAIDDDVKLFDKDDTIYLNKDNPTIYPYSKAICQALVLPVPRVGIVEISYDELINIPSERGLGMLGSSNK